MPRGILRTKNKSNLDGSLISRRVLFVPSWIEIAHDKMERLELFTVKQISNKRIHKRINHKKEKEKKNSCKNERNDER